MIFSSICFLLEISNDFNLRDSELKVSENKIARQNWKHIELKMQFQWIRHTILVNIEHYGYIE